MITTDDEGNPLVQEGGLADERLKARCAEVADECGLTLDDDVQEELYNLLAHYMLEDTATDYTDAVACATDNDDTPAPDNVTPIRPAP